MAQDYVRQGETFRAEGVASKKVPVVVVGAHARVSKGVESVDCTNTSAHNLTVPSGATHADITMEGGATTDYVRFWHGATDPTSTIGVKLYDGQMLVSADPATFTAIKGSTGNGGTLRVEYYAWE